MEVNCAAKKLKCRNDAFCREKLVRRWGMGWPGGSFGEGNSTGRQAEPPGSARIPDPGKGAREMGLAHLALVRQDGGFRDETAQRA
jgi:hypothetical protein